jgi:hypothetical protein
MSIRQRNFTTAISHWLSKQTGIKQLVLCLGALLLILSMLPSCADDPEEVFQTFLQKNDNTQWALSDGDLIVYIRINDDDMHLIEQWRYIREMECYEYNSNIFIPGNYAILENSENQLVVSCDPFLGDCEQLTFHIEGEALQVDVQTSEWQEETVLFFESRQNLDALTICEVQDKEDQNRDGWPFFCDR